MRNSFNGLAVLAEKVFEKDPLSGHLFVFFNKEKDRIKILFWDHGGLCIFAKRLERGRFRTCVMHRAGQSHVELHGADLAMLLEGIDINSAKRQKLWKYNI